VDSGENFSIASPENRSKLTADSNATESDLEPFSIIKMRRSVVVNTYE
jgi:hypothetical protein